MPKRNKTRLINHYRKILETYTDATIRNSDPGNLIRFNYSGKNIYDKRPLIIFLGIDPADNLVHGINLNYLYEDTVQRLFEKINSRFPVTSKSDHLVKESYTKIHLASTGLFSAQKLYEVSIKPFLVPSVESSYRTYKIKNISSVEYIKYELDRLK